MGVCAALQQINAHAFRDVEFGMTDFCKTGQGLKRARSDLADVTDAKARSVVVGVRHGADRAMQPLYYAADGAALAGAIETAKDANL